MTFDPGDSRVTVRDLGLGDYPAGAVFGPRSLADYEFVWMLSGSAHWACGPARIELVPGQLLLARPGADDTFFWDRSRRSAHGYVHFELAPRPSTSVAWPAVASLSEGDLPAALLDQLLRIGRSRRFDWRDRASAVTELLFRLFIAGFEPETVIDEVMPGQVERVAEFVEREWARRVRGMSLAELAAAASISTGHLCRLFRELFGVGPVRAFELLRLEHAARLLARSNLTVSQVATACGYANPYHFSSSFRGATGIPPSRYRASSPTERETASPVGRHGLRGLARRMWL